MRSSAGCFLANSGDQSLGQRGEAESSGAAFTWAARARRLDDKPRVAVVLLQQQVGRSKSDAKAKEAVACRADRLAGHVEVRQVLSLIHI